jgi:starch synthase (maltosyl-transferring)
VEQLPIALCATDLDVGGAERCLVEVASRLDRQRFCPVVYALGPRPTDDDASLFPALEAAQIEVHCLGARRKSAILPTVGRLTRLLAAQQPRLVQTFLFHANIVGRIAARRAGVPYVVSGIRVAERRRWHLWTDRLTDRLVDRHVCVSRAVAEFAEKTARLPTGKLVVIPNAIDLGRYPTPKAADLSPLGIPAGQPVVAFVGRLDRQKGLPWLLNTAASWLGRLPGCHLLLVGKGPLKAQLERICRRSGIAARVHFAGWRADVPEILAASSLLVLPSVWEGMPNVVLEAMASRLPVVATRVEGVAELLGPATDEQTVDYGDSQALSEKLVKYVENRESAAELGAKNRGRVVEHFGIERMVRAYEDLWTSLVGR